MRQNTKGPAHAAKRSRPVLVLVLVLLVLVLAAGVALRLYGWSGQRVEGQLTALVNPWNGVDAANYHPSLVQVEGIEVDQSCAQALQSLLTACRSAGYEPLLESGYISRADLKKTGVLSMEQIEPGYSEHEIGLAVDIRSARGESDVAAWLKENAWRYGFILRYPEGAEETTGTAACPWHFRYVGEAAAAQIQQLNITLEEYVTMFYSDSAAVEFEK